MFYEDDNIVGSNDFSESVENYFSDLTRNRHKPLTNLSRGLKKEI